MGLSIIIPTRNKAPYLYRTLSSLEPQLESGMQVVVVNNGSNDATARVIDQFACRWTTTVTRLSSHSPGRSAARNLGIEAARNPRVLFLDDDCICPPGLLQQHLAPGQVTVGRRREILAMAPMSVVDVGQAQRAMGLPGPTVHPAGEHVSLLEPYELTDTRLLDSLAADFRATAKRDRYLMAADNRPLSWMTAISSHLSVDVDDLHQVGGFDPQFSGWGEEDIEMSYRLHRLSPIRLGSGPPIYHQVHRPASVGNYESWFFNYIRAAEKHDASFAWKVRWKVVLGLLTLEEAEALLSSPDASRIADEYLEFVSTGRGAPSVPAYLAALVKGFVG